ncbi:MAG: ATP-binding cassette domain-containing protein [Alphaproteobacteria bacterium]|nr:ATP-binding cassette domain-containing protein [Alphaproteobacteria bacterium]TAD90429.1 MAG: ATP-binding cassette domain-containing protein [Alphaproteobacteria bacterium]
MIELQDVHLKLASAAGEVNILRGVSLAVAAGETVGLVGPSGAGKSSLMMVIGGLEQATSGRVQVAGADLTRLSEDQLALWRRAQVGIVFQSFRLIPTMTALENVAVPLELAGAKDAFDRAATQLAAVGLGHRLDHYPDQLSGGEQQRTALARAFVGQPKLLLADEPTGNLDGGTGRQIIDLMFGLSRQHGTTLLLITHDLDLARQCGRVVRIADGLIAADERGVAAAA